MQIKELTPKYAALAAAVEAKIGARVERLPTSTGELGYRVDAANLLDVCRAAARHARAQVRDPHRRLRRRLLRRTASTSGRRTARAAPASAAAACAGPAAASGDEEQIEAVGYEPAGRFAAVYHLLSITHNHRLRLKAFCPSDERPILDSVYPIWNSADWYEREAFDLYGILFRGHPDLRRLLTDYGFIGHPFRKDFPLIGNVEVRYDPVKGRVVYEPVSIEPRTLVPKVIRSDNRYREDLEGSQRQCLRSRISR